MILNKALSGDVSFNNLFFEILKEYKDKNMMADSDLIDQVEEFAESFFSVGGHTHEIRGFTELYYSLLQLPAELHQQVQFLTDLFFDQKTLMNDTKQIGIFDFEKELQIDLKKLVFRGKKTTDDAVVKSLTVDIQGEEVENCLSMVHLRMY